MRQAGEGKELGAGKHRAFPSVVVIDRPLDRQSVETLAQGGKSAEA